MSKRAYVTVDTVLHDLRARCEAEGSQTVFAQLHGLSPAYVSDVLSGRREPGESMLAALGYELMVRKLVAYIGERDFNPGEST